MSPILEADAGGSVPAVDVEGDALLIEGHVVYDGEATGLKDLAQHLSACAFGQWLG